MGLGTKEKEGVIPHTVILVDPFRELVRFNTLMLGCSGLEMSVPRIRKLPPGDVA